MSPRTSRMSTGTASRPLGGRARCFLALGFAWAVGAAGVVGVVACDDSGAVHETVTPDAGKDSGGVTDGGGGEASPGSDCFENPTTYEEIINACTDAAKIDKHPVLPHLLPDGGLPPLK